MKKIQLIVLFLAVLSGVQASFDTNILYSAEQISVNRWQYTYEVRNLSLAEGIHEFTVWFDLGLYENLQIASPAFVQSDWAEIIWQPEPLLLDDGGYDAKTLTVPITIGNSFSGFAVSFDWLGQGTPGSQYYEIVNPNTLITLDSGYTSIPEPLSIGLMLTGLFFIKRHKVF